MIPISSLHKHASVLVLYRAAYAVATLFGNDAIDGHFRWSVAQLASRPTDEVLGL